MVSIFASIPLNQQFWGKNRLGVGEPYFNLENILLDVRFAFSALQKLGKDLALGHLNGGHFGCTYFIDEKRPKSQVSKYLARLDRWI